MVLLVCNTDILFCQTVSKKLGHTPAIGHPVVYAGVFSHRLHMLHLSLDAGYAYSLLVVSCSCHVRLPWASDLATDTFQQYAMLVRCQNYLFERAGGVLTRLLKMRLQLQFYDCQHVSSYLS